MTQDIEELARRIHETPVEDWKFTHAELRAADEWTKNYAVDSLRKKLGLGKPALSQAFIDWAVSCANLTFGSVETDAMLIALNCYPDWMMKKEPEVVS